MLGNKGNWFYWSGWPIKYKEIKNARRTGKTCGTSLAVQKISKWHHESGCDGVDCIRQDSKKKTVHGCIVESHHSTRQRVESSQPKHHEDHIAGTRITSMSHCNFCTSLFQCHKRWRFQMQRMPVDKEWTKVRNDSSTGFGKSQEQEGGYSGSTHGQK